MGDGTTLVTQKTETLTYVFHMNHKQSLLMFLAKRRLVVKEGHSHSQRQYREHQRTSEHRWPKPVGKRNTERNHERAENADDGYDDKLARGVSTNATCLCSTCST